MSCVDDLFIFLKIRHAGLLAIFVHKRTPTCINTLEHLYINAHTLLYTSVLNMCRTYNEPRPARSWAVLWTNCSVFHYLSRELRNACFCKAVVTLISYFVNHLMCACFHSSHISIWGRTGIFSSDISNGMVIRDGKLRDLIHITGLAHYCALTFQVNVITTFCPTAFKAWRI